LDRGAGRSGVPVNALELVGPVLILATIAAAVIRPPRPVARLAVAACAGALAFLPVGPATIGAFLLAVFGPVSAATIVLCAIYLRTAISGPGRAQLPSRAFLLCLFVTGLVFYSLAFGLTTFDPYDLGYRGVTVPALMLVYLLIGWLARAPDIPCWIGLAALLYLIDASNSNNLWDYLLFPLDPVAAALMLGIPLARRLVNRCVDIESAGARSRALSSARSPCSFFVRVAVKRMLGRPQ